MPGELRTVEDGFKTALLAFTATQDTVPPVAWPDNGYTPVSGTLYLEPTFRPNRGGVSGVGRVPARRLFGLFQVDVNYSTGSGSEAGADMADALMAYFMPPARSFITSGSTTIRLGYQGQPPYRTGKFTKDGWSTIPISISWWVDVIPT